MIVLHPLELLELPHLPVVDIRPDEERYGGLGFIPGSLGIPLERGPGSEPYAQRLRETAGTSMVALVCTSGARARACAVSLEAQHDDELSVSVVEGGVLAWGASGLPLAGLGPRRGQALPPEEIPRHLMACFVGELADVSIEEGIDPVEILHDCFRRAGTSVDEPGVDQLYRVLDHAATHSLRLGTPMLRVAANLDRMLALLPAPASSP